MSWQEKLNNYLTPKRQRFILIGLLIVYALMLTYKINEPLTRRYDEFNFSYGVAARNWLTYGPIQLKFAMMTLVPNNFVELSIEIIKSISPPPLKQKLEIMFVDRDPRKDNANDAKNTQAFIDEHKLQSVGCSTTFCLYKKI